jgi:YgiT-type zinc finger domain-containing protein
MERSSKKTGNIVMQKSSAELLICDLCGQEGAKIRYVTRSYGKGENLLVIEDVPVVSCPHCGESYLTAETLQELERIKLHRQSFAEPRAVPVAVFV